MRYLTSMTAGTKKTRSNTDTFIGINAGFGESAWSRGRKKRLIT
jgi:hypothetical protein